MMPHTIDHNRTLSLIEKWASETQAQEHTTQLLKRLVLTRFENAGYTPSLRGLSMHLKQQVSEKKELCRLAKKVCAAARFIQQSKQNPTEALDTWVLNQMPENQDSDLLGLVKKKCLSATPDALLHQYGPGEIDAEELIKGLTYLEHNSNTLVDNALIHLDEWKSKQPQGSTQLESAYHKLRYDLICKIHEREFPLHLASLTPREAVCIETGRLNRLGLRLQLTVEGSQYLAKNLNSPELDTEIEKQGSTCFATHRLIGVWK